jgi:hypothetical protein
VPKLSKSSAAEHTEQGPVERWGGDIDGHTIEFLNWKVDIDSTPMLKGLPGDPCPHWGFVLEGKVIYHVRRPRGAPRSGRRVLRSRRALATGASRHRVPAVQPDR